MYQMFLICFIKRPLMKDVSRVVRNRLAKGQKLVVTTVGNKGCLCYSFSLKNHDFNILGCHLKHKMENQDKRNHMSRQLIDELDMSEL